MTARRPALLLAAALALAAGSVQAKEASKENTATYTSFDALTATIWRTDGRRGVLTVQGGLDIQDARLRTSAKSFTPILRDAYVRALNVYAQALVPVLQLHVREQEAEIVLAGTEPG